MLKDERFEITWRKDWLTRSGLRRSPAGAQTFSSTDVAELKAPAENMAISSPNVELSATARVRLTIPLRQPEVEIKSSGTTLPGGESPRRIPRPGVRIPSYSIEQVKERAIIRFRSLEVLREEKPKVGSLVLPESVVAPRAICPSIKIVETKAAKPGVRQAKITVAEALPRISPRLEVSLDDFAVAKEGPGEPRGEPRAAWENFIQPLSFIKELSALASTLERPVCVVLPRVWWESYIRAMATICREIYRIVKGGMPESRWVSISSESPDNEMKWEEIKRGLRAEGTIFVIDDPHCRLEGKKKMFVDRLRELFSQGYGFIIFHVGQKCVEELYAELKRYAGARAEVVKISPPTLWPEIKMRVASACWGFVDSDGETFDEIFENAERRYYQELEKVRRDYELQLYIKSDPSASPEHEIFKAIVVESLAKRYGASTRKELVRLLSEGKIKTEHVFDNRRADIYDGISGRFVEIETLYGTGEPMKKIKETLEKYKGTGKRVDIILPGLQALLYADDLRKIAEIYRKEHSINVDFYMVNLKHRELIRLEDYLSELGEYMKSMEVDPKV